MYTTLTSLVLGKAEEAAEGGGAGGGAGGSLTGGASACEEGFIGGTLWLETGAAVINASTLVCDRIVDFGVD